MLGKARQMSVSSFNEDGDNCDTCRVPFVSGSDESKERDHGPDLYVRKLACAASIEDTLSALTTRLAYLGHVTAGGQ